MNVGIDYSKYLIPVLVEEAVKETSGLYRASEMMGDKDKIEQEIKRRINERMNEYDIKLDSVISKFDIKDYVDTK